ncbi:MAG: hypothetical protein IPO94_08615 [Saprospiraceae bacterium]|nr:hypothetical protein [Saprospiraceae bacterium]
MRFTLDPSVPEGTIIENCLTGTASNSGLVVNDGTSCISIIAIPPDPYSTLTLKKAFTYANGSWIGGSALIPGTIVYTQLNPKIEAGGLPLENPMVMDLLPHGLDYLDYAYGTTFTFKWSTSTCRFSGSTSKL